MSAADLPASISELLVDWEKKWKELDVRTSRAGGDSDHNLARGLQLRECIAELKEKAGIVDPVPSSS